MTRRDNLILIPNKLEQIQKLKESFEDGVLKNMFYVFLMGVVTVKISCDKILRFE